MMEHVPTYQAETAPQTPRPIDLFGRDCLHEITPENWKQSGPTLGFTAALAARRITQKQAPCLWIQHRSTIPDEGTLFGPGLRHYGLDPDMLMILRPTKEQDALAMMEQGLEAGCFAAIVGSLPDGSRRYDLTASRRLQLRAKTAKTPLFLIRHGSPAPSAALCRWQVRAARPQTLRAQPSWHLNLIRSRISPPGDWRVSWTHETHSFSVPAASADGTSDRHATTQ